MVNLSDEEGRAEITELKTKLINKYLELNKQLYEQDFDKVLKTKSEIYVIEKQLNKQEFHVNYNADNQRILTIAEKILLNNENSKQLLFDIKELTGNGNYKQLDYWSLSEIIDYTKRKKKQIDKQKALQQIKHK